MSHRESAQSSGGALVVIGNGMASQRLCERLAALRRTRETRVVVFAEESVPAYDRVHLGDALRGRPGAQLELRPEEWYREAGIELYLKDPVDRVDPARRLVVSARGERVEYDQLVFATGSAALFPPLPGMDAEGVLGYRTLEEAEAIRASALGSAARGRAVGVLGGGLLGIESARLLAQLGCRVLVIERAPHLLPRQLPRAASLCLEKQLRALGIDLRMATALRGIKACDSGLRLDLGMPDAPCVDLLLVAIGVRPRDELARAAGIACDPAGGILIDDRLRTSAPDVYAIGECARHRGVLHGLAAPALAMAERLAENLACSRSDAERDFAAPLTLTHLKVDDIEVAAVGDTIGDGTSVDLLLHEESDRVRGVVVEDGRVIGALRVGAWQEWPSVQDAVLRGTVISPRARERFARSGALWPESSARIASWSDSALVCACTGVTCGALRACMRAGAADADALAERTRASTVCGSCRPLLEELVGGEAAEPAPRRDAGLVIGAGLAALLALVLVAWPPISLSDSVQTAARFEVLWTESWLRQLTGFAALGTAVASLVLSARKRVRRFQRGSFAGWRRVHAWLGVGSLAAVAVHTGLRGGANLDAALLVCFALLAVLGSGAGALAALESHLPVGSGAALRRVASQSHVWVLWPFSVLVLFHVLKIYWF